MDQETKLDWCATAVAEEREIGPYLSPTVEVIALDCEISAYAPDGDEGPPLF